MASTSAVVPKLGRLRRLFNFTLDYARRVGLDYRDVAVDVAKGAAERPLKNGLVAVGLWWGGFAFYSVPSSESYALALGSWRRRLGLLGYGERNPVTADFVSRVSALANSGRLEYRWLGPVALLLSREEPPVLATAVARAKAMTPRLRDLPSRVVDVGAFGQWFFLRRATADYDIDHALFEREEALRNSQQTAPVS